MTAPTGIQATFSGSTDGTTYHLLALATDVKPGGTKNEMADRTYYGQGDRQKRRSVTLKDNTVTIKMDFDPTDARVQEIVAAADAGSDYYFEVLYNGTNGWKAKGVVESYDVSPPINGKQELTATWLPNADKTSLP